MRAMIPSAKIESNPNLTKDLKTLQDSTPELLDCSPQRRIWRQDRGERWIKKTTSEEKGDERKELFFK